MSASSLHAGRRQRLLDTVETARHTLGFYQVDSVAKT